MDNLNLNLFVGETNGDTGANTTVGKSERTPYKHRLFDQLLGREVGVSTSTKLQGHDVHIIDLCSGDGVVADDQRWDHSCSPGIIARHAAWAARNGKTVFVWGHEVATGTYDKLLASLNTHLPELGYSRASSDGDWWNYSHRPFHEGSVQYHTRNVNSSTVEFPMIGEGSLVFILNDPNTIHKWAANARAIRQMVNRGAWVTTLHTMGCNAGGLKRIDYESRMGWQNYIDEVLEYVDKRRQTCVIACIDGDESQWGYLITYPNKWGDKLKTDLEKAFAAHRHPLRIAEHGKDEFEDILDYLFLTRKEVKAGVTRGAHV